MALRSCVPACSSSSSPSAAPSGRARNVAQSIPACARSSSPGGKLPVARGSGNSSSSSSSCGIRLAGPPRDADAFQQQQQPWRQQQEAVGLLLEEYRHPAVAVPWLASLESSLSVDRLESLYQLSHAAWQLLPAQADVGGQGVSAGVSDTLALPVQLGEPPSSSRPARPSNGGPTPPGGNGKDPDFYVNAGTAIRVLREDIPALFQRDLDYDIYRDDIVFRDPRNVFKGMKNYKTIFWSLRFHGRIFFRSLYVEIQRVWQPEDKQIKMRWKVHGVPRIPWETEGTFDGISTFKLDSHGKIYEHQVDNVIFRDTPPLSFPLFARLNLSPAGNLAGQQPCPGAFSQQQQQQPSINWFVRRFSWVRLYAVLVASAWGLPAAKASRSGGRGGDGPDGGAALQAASAASE